MRDVIPYLFWPWFFLSCFVLLRRRVSHGSWRAMGTVETEKPIEFPPPPPAQPLPAASAIAASDAPVDADPPTPTPPPSPVAVMEPFDPERPPARTLAEAVDGIVMPCDLAPLMGTGPLDPRQVAFFTHGHPAGDVGASIADEFERLGFAIRPVDERTVRAERGADQVQVRLNSAELTSVDVMRDHHPSAPEEALVVELKLT